MNTKNNKEKYMSTNEAVRVEVVEGMHLTRNEEDGTFLHFDAGKTQSGICLDKLDVWSRTAMKWADKFIAMKNREGVCQCAECKKLYEEKGEVHSSDCAVHNAPSLPNGACDCVDLFSAEKLAIKFCEQYEYEKGSKEYDVSIVAFCAGLGQAR